MEKSVEGQINLEQACRLALELARKGLGKVEPNPCVGAVIFNEETNKLVSYGYHSKFGALHAEPEALKSINNGEGLTLVVTLEPCSHFGKTAPCADLIIEKKIKKVIYFDQDPNPKVAGKGLEKLKQAGVTIVKASAEMSQVNRRLNDKFFYSFENNKSFVHLKWAQSLDGKMSLNGESKWITTREQRDQAHFLRAQSDAILIGRETLEKDDPRLDVRLEGYEKNLKVLIFDPGLKTISKIKEKKIFEVRGGSDNLIWVSNQKIEGVQTLNFDPANLNSLAENAFSKFKIQSIFVEGGAKTISHFLKQNAYNKISIFIGNKIIGRQGTGVGDFFNIKSMGQNLDLSDQQIKLYFSN